MAKRRRKIWWAILNSPLKRKDDMKEIVINGNDFYGIDGFYAEIDRLLTKDLTWKI